MFIALLHYKVPREELEPYLPAHHEFLKEGYDNNIFIASGRMYSGKGGVIISSLTRRGEVEQMMREDPFVIHGLADLEIIGFEPSRFHPEFLSFVHEPEKTTIELVPYTSNWDNLFKQEAQAISSALGNTLVTIHHIGSTAIPGILAKPIIDMIPVVKNIRDVDPLIPKMEALGYVAMGEYGMPGRRFFTKSKDGKRFANVHIFEDGHPDIERHLRFRDYLKAHPHDATLYSELKEKLILSSADDMEKYCWGKEDLIKEIEKKALHWYNSRSKNQS